MPNNVAPSVRITACIAEQICFDNAMRQPEVLCKSQADTTLDTLRHT